MLREDGGCKFSVAKLSGYAVCLFRLRCNSTHTQATRGYGDSHIGLDQSFPCTFRIKRVALPTILAAPWGE